MIVITEDQYNDHLREQADVAMIAGKYEDLLDRFEEQIAEQQRIEEKLAELRKKAAGRRMRRRTLAEFSEAYADQKRLNEDLANIADDMENFGRENPVYDFEKELQEKLREQAEADPRIREDNRRPNRTRRSKRARRHPQARTPEMMEEMETAAREQRERLRAAANGERGNPRTAQGTRRPSRTDEGFQPLRATRRRAARHRGTDRRPIRTSRSSTPRTAWPARTRRAPARPRAETRTTLEETQTRCRGGEGETARSRRQRGDNSRNKSTDASMPGLARTGGAEHARCKGRRLPRPGRQAARGNGAPDGGRRATRPAGVSPWDSTALLRLQRGMNPGDSFRQMMLSNKFRGMPGEGGRRTAWAA